MRIYIPVNVDVTSRTAISCISWENVVVDNDASVESFWEKVALIHWGGHQMPFDGRLSRIFRPFSLKLLNKMFVLMTPEVEYYGKWLPRSKLEVLPYCLRPYSDAEQDVGSKSAVYERNGKSVKNLILGPSAWWIDGYARILDKIPVGSWDRIVCMVSYGLEKRQEKLNAFIEKYEAKFGRSFLRGERQSRLKDIGSLC